MLIAVEVAHNSVRAGDRMFEDFMRFNGKHTKQLVAYKEYVIIPCVFYGLYSSLRLWHSSACISRLVGVQIVVYDHSSKREFISLSQ